MKVRNECEGLDERGRAGPAARRGAGAARRRGLQVPQLVPRASLKAKEDAGLHLFLRILIPFLSSVLLSLDHSYLISSRIDMRIKNTDLINSLFTLPLIRPFLIALFLSISINQLSASCYIALGLEHFFSYFLSVSFANL